MLPDPGRPAPLTCMLCSVLCSCLRPDHDGYLLRDIQAKMLAKSEGEHSFPPLCHQSSSPECTGDPISTLTQCSLPMSCVLRTMKMEMQLEPLLSVVSWHFLPTVSITVVWNPTVTGKNRYKALSCFLFFFKDSFRQLNIQWSHLKRARILHQTWIFFFF